MDPWLPKSILVLRGYDGVTFRQDLIAGVTVGLVALPLAMAFAIASGLTPQAGIYCAIVTGFLISALGGSRVQIGGPTGAFVVVISGIVAEHGVPGLFMCTMMAGVMLVVLGVTGTGTAVRFIPRPVVIGFTNGIAVLIASTQIRDFLGLRMAENPGEFIGRLAAIGRHLDTITPAAFGLAVTTIVLVLATNRFVKGIPGTVVGLVVGTGVAWVAQLPVETVASRFGAVPSGLPALHIPAFRPSLMLTLLSPALTVCILGAIESLMSAVVADRMTGDRHNPNVEQDKHIPDYVTILRIHGPFLFGTTDKLQSVLDRIDELTPIVVFRLRNMTAIDATGLRALEDMTLRLRSSGRTAVFCGAREQPKAVMEQTGFVELAGAENVCANVEAALARARSIHDRVPPSLAPAGSE